MLLGKSRRYSVVIGRKNDPFLSLFSHSFISTLLVVSVSKRSCTFCFMKDGPSTSVCQGESSPVEVFHVQGDRYSWQCFSHAQVGKKNALAVGHHQKRNEMGQLQQSRPEMFLTRDARYEVSGGEVWGTAPMGFLSSYTGLFEVLLIGVRPDAGGPESEEPGKAMVRRCLEKDFPHSA
jgi:hypothetical protein